MDIDRQIKELKFELFIEGLRLDNPFTINSKDDILFRRTKIRGEITRLSRRLKIKKIMYDEQ